MKVSEVMFIVAGRNRRPFVTALQYRKSSIKPPEGLIFFSHFKRGEGGGGLKERRGLFSLAKRITCIKNSVV